jgi:tRNA(fMet)-specific endonuclease VapC
MEGRSEALLDRIARKARSDLGIPSIAVAELHWGVVNSSRTRAEANRRRLADFLGPVEIVPFEQEAAAQYASLRLHLESTGEPIGLMDMLIAATALANDGILVTHNVEEFSRVPGLRYEDWTIPI